MELKPIWRKMKPIWEMKPICGIVTYFLPLSEIDTDFVDVTYILPSTKSRDLYRHYVLNAHAFVPSQLNIVLQVSQVGSADSRPPPVSKPRKQEGGGKNGPGISADVSVESLLGLEPFGRPRRIGDVDKGSIVL